jgi:hypothetical protein
LWKRETAILISSSDNSKIKMWRAWYEWRKKGDVGGIGRPGGVGWTGEEREGGREGGGRADVASDSHPIVTSLY